MWESWIQNYGYIAVFFGSVLEGETVLILAGYSMSRGYLDPVPTFLLAVAGGTAGDSLYFWLGRRFGARLLRSLAVPRPYRARAKMVLRRWGRQAAFTTRFAYGLRLALPMLIGAARMPALLFHTFNLIAATLFAVLYLGLGFMFGEAVQEILGRVRPYEHRILLSVICLGAIIWIIREYRLLRSAPPEEDDDEVVL
jgi:membrane protein DedA with SNARE-associated domain